MGMEYMQRKSACHRDDKSMILKKQDRKEIQRKMMNQDDFHPIDFNGMAKKQVVQRKVIRTEEGGRRLYSDEERPVCLAAVDSSRGSVKVDFTKEALDRNLIVQKEVEDSLEDGSLTSAKMLELLAQKNRRDVETKYPNNGDNQRREWFEEWQAHRQILNILNCFKEPLLIEIDNHRKRMHDVLQDVLRREDVRPMLLKQGGRDFYDAIVYLSCHINKPRYIVNCRKCQNEIRDRYKEMEQEAQFLIGEVHKTDIGSIALKSMESVIYDGMVGNDCGKFANTYKDYLGRSGFYQDVRNYSYHAWTWITILRDDLDGAVTAETCVGQGENERVVFNIRPTKDNKIEGTLSMEEDKMSISEMGASIHKNLEVQCDKKSIESDIQYLQKMFDRIQKEATLDDKESLRKQLMENAVFERLDERMRFLERISNTPSTEKSVKKSAKELAKTIEKNINTIKTGKL